jgi:hypothetical protein
MGEFVDPILVPNLTSRQVQRQQKAICHTLSCGQASQPATSPLQDGKDLPSAKHVSKLKEEVIR